MRTRPFLAHFLAILLLFTPLSHSLASSKSENIPVSGQKEAPDAARVTTPAIVPPAPDLNVKGYVLMDANTGKVLAEKAMNTRMAPASLTKIMTLYITFQALANNQIKLDDKVRISKKAWKMGGSRMFINVGSEVTVEDLIRGVIVASGNDACVALAEYVAGTETTFATLMNQTAQQLGMTATRYIDSTGLPSANHYSTPYDMAILTRAMINDFPAYYHYFNEKWLTYNNIKQPNRNRLLWRDQSVDGLKTGHTDAAGYCLIASAKRDNMRLISIVMGAPTDGERSRDSQALLNYGFRFYRTYQLFSANEPVSTPRIWMAKQKHDDFGLTSPLYVTIPAGENKNLRASIHLDHQLKAPIVAGNTYGELQVYLSNQQIATAPLVALKNDPKAGFFARMIDHVMFFFKG